MRLYGRALSGAEVSALAGSSTIHYASKHHEKNVTADEVTSYYHFGGKLVALRKGAALEYLHQEHLGGTAMTTDSITGAKKGEMKYLPFGGTRSGVVLSTDNKYTGERLDGTGLYFLNARYYDPEIGRFISPDPIVSSEPWPLGYRIVPLTVSYTEPTTLDVLAALNRLGVKSTGLPSQTMPQELNRYSYALNNPLRYVDPDGHQVTAAMAPAAGMAAIVAALVVLGVIALPDVPKMDYDSVREKLIGLTLFAASKREPTFGDSEKKAVDEVLEGATSEKGNRSVIAKRKEGGDDQANEDFDKLAKAKGQGERIRDYGEKGRGVTLEDGTKIFVRPNSGTKANPGLPTLDIQPKDKSQKTIKVRYDE